MKMPVLLMGLAFFSASVFAGGDASSSENDQTTNIDSVAAPSNSFFNSNSVSTILPRMGIEYCDTPYVKFGASARADEPESAIIGMDFVIPLGTGNCAERVASLREEVIRGKQIENRSQEIEILTGVFNFCKDQQNRKLSICRDVEGALRR